MPQFCQVTRLLVISVIFCSSANAQVRIDTVDPIFTDNESSTVVSSLVQPEMPDDMEENFVSTQALLEAADSPDPKKAAAAAAALKKKKADLKKAVAGAYAPVWYNNNFSYLNNPLYEDHYLGEAFKQRTIGDNWTYDIGGQYRVRFMDEANMRGAGLTGKDDEFYLQRERVFANLQYNDRFRIYAEVINATSNDQFYTPRSIEVENINFLNLLADLKVYDNDNGDMRVRGGRQELLYGSQRLISPLDWANTRRTFQGGKVFWQGKDWNFDGFYTNPVIVNPDGSVFGDQSQTFAGGWATYKGIKDQTVDLYAIEYSNTRLPADFNYCTLGGRYTGIKEGWLWDFEGGVQTGRNTDGSDHAAGFFTGGSGYKWEDHAWAPTLWGYYDWASGANEQGKGNGFNQLFPFGHNYLGFMDLYGRSNISTPNVQFSFKPHEKLNVLLWYYDFMLANIHDTPYNVSGTAFAPGSKPGSRQLGQEIDLTFNYAINPRQNVLIGYSHFFAGEYYKTTPGLPYRSDANFVYTQYQVNF